MEPLRFSAPILGQTPFSWPSGRSRGLDAGFRELPGVEGGDVWSGKTYRRHGVQASSPGHGSRAAWPFCGSHMLLVFFPEQGLAVMKFHELVTMYKSKWWEVSFYI